MRDSSLWLTAADVARRLSLSEAQVRGLYASDQCPFHVCHFGRNTMVWHVDLENFLTAGTPPETTLEAMVEAGFERALLNVLADHNLRPDLRYERKSA